jgi:predicted RNase H-like nuclease (RuvC/YqgF family)
MTAQDVIEWLGLPAAGGVIGWLSGRRKSKAEGVEATILVFERTVKHLEEQVEELRKENKELRDRVKHLEEKYHRAISNS